MLLAHCISWLLLFTKSSNLWSFCERILSWRLFATATFCVAASFLSALRTPSTNLFLRKWYCFLSSLLARALIVHTSSSRALILLKIWSRLLLRRLYIWGFLLLLHLRGRWYSAGASSTASRPCSMLTECLQTELVMCLPRAFSALSRTFEVLVRGPTLQ